MIHRRTERQTASLFYPAITANKTSQQRTKPQNVLAIPSLSLRRCVGFNKGRSDSLSESNDHAIPFHAHVSFICHRDGGR